MPVDYITEKTVAARPLIKGIEIMNFSKLKDERNGLVTENDKVADVEKFAALSAEDKAAFDKRTVRIAEIDADIAKIESFAKAKLEKSDVKDSSQIR